ncbi:MAG: cobalt-precorrin-7 (C5)-methyltransferase [Clostridia bacterium]|nr:cobalt-precorrin-7 (C5)-methyltransferase [Clostridia bacterium]
MANKKRWLTVVGIGPGSPEYLTPAAYKAALMAEVLVGGKRALGLFKDLEKDKHVISGNLEKLYNYLLQRYGRKTAVLVSGDPGFYSLLKWLKGKFPNEDITVIPGISSVQLAFSYLKEGWEDVTFLSLHGRTLEKLDAYIDDLSKGCTKLAILTGGANNPSAIGKYLVSKGISSDMKLWLGIDLGTEHEEIHQVTIKELIDKNIKKAGVVIIGYDKC